MEGSSSKRGWRQRQVSLSDVASLEVSRLLITSNSQALRFLHSAIFLFCRHIILLVTLTILLFLLTIDIASLVLISNLRSRLPSVKNCPSATSLFDPHHRVILSLCLLPIPSPTNQYRKLPQPRPRSKSG